MKKVYFISSYSNYPKAIVGESAYQDNIQNILVYTGDEKKRIREDGFHAEIILEDENEFDPGNAVRVEIDGEIVGYLSRSDASWYRRAIAKLGLVDVIGVCGAAISGKKESEFEDHNFGVFLDLDLKNLQVEPQKVLEPSVVESPTTPAKKKQPVKFGGKMPLIPINGKGLLYWLVIFPVVGIINLYIILFWGIWYIIKWLWDTASTSQK